MSAAPLGEAMRVLQRVRAPGDVVITTMGPARAWLSLGPLDPLDFVLVPSSMGQATSLGLGLALARPDHRIVVVNGDGSMLMNLGSLVTIAAERPANLVVIVADNGAYEVTGAQPTPGAALGRAGRDRVDFAGSARAAGFPSVFRFTTLAEWVDGLQAAMDGAGPVFVWLDVTSDPTIGGPRSPGPAGERARRFMAALR